jgi:hypothetical protein
LAFVRQHPEMFRHLAYDGPSAAALLTEAALRKLVARIEIRHIGDWYVVHSGNDWLEDLGGKDTFTQLIPFPELGPNAVYPEVIVTAFAAALTTISNEIVRTVVGEVPDIEALAHGHSGEGRTVIFRVPKVGGP